MRRAVGVTLVCLLAMTAATVVVDRSPVAVAKKSKKVKECKSGYYRYQRKCHKYITVKPSSITIIAGKLRAGTFSVTGYFYYPGIKRRGLVSGYWHLHNGLGKEKRKFKMIVPQDSNYSAFSGSYKGIGITGETVTATLVIQGVTSAPFVLMK